MKVFTYRRVSSAEQASEGDSLAMQAQKLHQWAQFTGNQIAGEFCDEGISGYESSKRPQFTEMIQRALAGECDVIAVYSIKRFARNTLTTLETILALEKKGVSFISLTENIDTTTPIGKFILTVFAGLAQLERDETAQRTRDVLRYKKSQGEVVGTVPYGYYRQIEGYDSKGNPELSKDLYEYPDEQRVLEIIRQLDGMGFAYIAEELNAMGHRNRRGLEWTARTVQKLHSKYIK